MSNAAALLAALSLAAASANAPAISIALALDPRLPPEIGRHAVDEAAAIWRPYGVSVRLHGTAAGHDAAQPANATLTIRIEPDTAGREPGATPLAAVRFHPGGEPEPTILLFYDAVQRAALAHAGVGGGREASWPPALRHRVVGRIVGRAVAHEIGHWLLRTRTHSDAGLMRAVHPTTRLMAAHRGHLALQEEDVARLRIAVRRLALEPE
jgi:hypothetical protein